MNRISFFVIAMLLICNVLMSQPDGTYPSKAFVREILKNLKNERSLNFDTAGSNLLVVLPLDVHIVNNQAGNAGIEPGLVEATVKGANTYFKPINISFSVNTIETIKDYNYSYLNKNDRNMQELLKKHTSANSINLYFLDEIKIDSLPVYGFTYYPTEADSNFIFLQKTSCNATALATMLGHYMGLLSTHNAPEGSELADESNCATAGDFICDTYADPNLYKQVNEECLYTGFAKDMKGNDYIPSVANIMSNSPDGCKCKFTFEQYRRMYFYYLNYRQNLKSLN